MCFCDGNDQLLFADFIRLVSLNILFGFLCWSSISKEKSSLSLIDKVKTKHERLRSNKTNT